MAKALNLLIGASSKLLSESTFRIKPVTNVSNSIVMKSLVSTHAPRAHCTLSAAMSRCSYFKPGGILTDSSTHNYRHFYSTEVDKEISKFLEKEIKYEMSKTAESLPKVPGFDIKTDGGDITLTKTAGSEKLVVRLSVNGAVDSVIADQNPEKPDEAPQMVCRPAFEVEISKGDGTIFALQCTFPQGDEAFEDGQHKDEDAGEIDDQFEIQEVAIHGGEWKDTTFSVSAATMDAELFDLLMDMLDERGITDDFIAQLVDFCTAYENKQYTSFLKDLKHFAENYSDAILYSLVEHPPPYSPDMPGGPLEEQTSAVWFPSSGSGDIIINALVGATFPGKAHL